MNISLDNINFCYQPSPPKLCSHVFPTSCWKPYQVPSAPARLSPPTSPISFKECAPMMANIPTQNATPGTFQQSQDLRVSSSGSTTAVRNEFDIEFEDTCLVENSSILSEKGPETNTPVATRIRTSRTYFRAGMRHQQLVCLTYSGHAS